MTLMSHQSPCGNPLCEICSNPFPPGFDEPAPPKTYNDGLEAAAKYIEWCASALTGTEPEYHALQETAKNIRALKEPKLKGK
jgi:hypothetical protein